MTIELEPIASTWDTGALIRVQGATIPTTYRPALFVFEAPQGGITWVEPSYLDPTGTPGNAAHTAVGEITDASTPNSPPVFNVDGAAWSALAMQMPYDGPEELLQPLDWATGQLQQQGTTWAAERERVRALLAAG